MADRFADYYYLKVSARAVVKGESLPITGFNIDYVLDAIPTAQINFPIGRSAKGAFGASPALSLLENIGPMTPVQILCQFEPDRGRGAPPGKLNGFPEGEFTIFDGFIGAPGFQKQTGAASLSIGAFGRPGALAGSTTLNQAVVSATGPNGGLRYGLAQFGSLPVAGNALEALLALPFEEDLWDGALLELVTSILQDLNAWTGGQNSFALSAVQAINKGEVLPQSELPLSEYVGSVPNIRLAIAKEVANSFFAAWANPDATGNVWNALGALSEAFLFHFVPGVSEDALAPVTPGLGGEPFRVIDPSEYGLIQFGQTFDENFYSYLTQVGLFSPWDQGSAWSDGVRAIQSLGEAFINADVLEGQGRLQLFPAPAWIHPPTDAGLPTLGGGTGIPDASNPEGAGPIVLAPFSQTAGNAIAETLLQEGLFAHRGMQLAGRFRTDIGPGSLVRVNGSTERFGGKPTALFGMVRRVSISVGEIGADSHAATQFSISSIRTESEHNTLTVEAHPLYDTAWRGSVLI